MKQALAAFIYAGGRFRQCAPLTAGDDNLENRIGRRTIFAILLIAAVVAIWALLGGR